MNPKFIDDMSWEMGEVYGAVCDRIMINLAKYFPYIEGALADDESVDAFKYQAKKLAQMGQVHTDTVKIIAQSLRGEEKAIRDALSAAILDALKDADPILRKAAEQGLLYGPGLLPPEVSPNQFNAFTQYYNQSMDKMNLVNTAMLESTEAAYQSCVSDITSKIRRTQSILNVGAGEMITGVSSLNDVVNSAVKKMVDNGLTGFVDHAGRRWRPETYVAMDMRTTLHNTANQAVWERCDEYGSDIYQVSTHNGARPLCYPWQAKLISRHDIVRDVEDIDGYTAHVYAQSETSYGQAAGLFGVNCGHYPMPFIPGFSALRGHPQPEEENERVYEESQKQRELERKLRKEKLDLAVMKTRGVPADQIAAQQARVKKASDDIKTFCDETGRTRRRDREYTPVNAKFPTKDSYNASTFPTATRDRINEWFGNNPPGGNSLSPGGMHLGPDNVPPAGATTALSPQPSLEQNLGTAYEYHRVRHGLNLVEYDPNDTDRFAQVDLSGMDEDAAKTVRDTISRLSQKYDTTLTTVRTMTRDEIREAGSGIACVRHDYRVDSSTMRINQMQCGNQSKLRDMVIRNIKSGYFSGVSDDAADAYVYTHEFGHTLINTRATLDPKTNFAGVDYGRISKIRDEINRVYADYAAEIGALERKAQELGERFEETFDLDAYEQGKQINQELRRKKLGEYSLTNADELFAESFAYTELGGTENPYAMRIRSIIDTYFRR